MKALCFLVCVLMCTVLQAQSFEGIITYKNKIESKLPNITSEQLTQMLGNTQEYFIKGNRYKSVVNGAVMQWQLYVPSENKLYNKTSDTDVLHWNDGSENRDSVLAVKMEKNADTLLGYPCDKLTLDCVGGTQMYWYNASVAKVDPALYRQHKLANWYEIISRTKALPLKSVLENPQFTLTSTATAVTPVSLNDSLFLLPPVAQTQKSRY